VKLLLGPEPVLDIGCGAVIHHDDFEGDVRAGGSGALGLADVAAGRIDGYIEAHINLWDVAAALVLLTEAGATVSDFMAAPGPVSGNPILACAPGVGAAMTALF
jgi:myo-inositol-1(or 4)-monophosphatase